jgi:hypothetical protein
MAHRRQPTRTAMVVMVLGVPTVKIIGPYRFYFFSADGWEPLHVHIRRDRAQAKFWLKPVRLQESRGFNRMELLRLHKLTFRHRHELTKKWHEYFGHQ